MVSWKIFKKMVVIVVKNVDVTSPMISADWPGTGSDFLMQRIMKLDGGITTLESRIKDMKINASHYEMNSWK